MDPYSVPFNRKAGRIRSSISKLFNISCDAISEGHFNDFRNYIDKLYNEDNLKVFEIADKIYYERRQATLLIFHDLKIKKKPTVQIKNNEKKIYWNDCAFKFSPYSEPNIIGYSLLKDHFFTKGFDDQSLHRDHMVSITYGWENSIPSEVISHPANCQILLARENIKKGSLCSITIDELMERIQCWNSKSMNNDIQPKNITGKSEQHKNNISKSLKNRMWYNNGIDAIFINNTDPIPDGYSRGKLYRKLYQSDKIGRYMADREKTYQYYDLYQKYKEEVNISFTDFVKTNSDITRTAMFKRFKRLNLPL